MAIIKVHTNDQYTAMSNHHLRDTSLTLPAMGLLSFMLSCSDKFKFSIEGLTKCSGSGETATRTALMELRNKGYVVVSRSTNEQGKVAEWVYDIYETPHVEKPDVEIPHVDNPVVENQGQRNNNISTTKESTLFGDESPLKVINESINIEVANDEGFEEAWALYGKKGNKQAARTYWLRLKKVDRDAILRTIPIYIAAKPDEKFRKDFSGWINPAYRRWEDKIVGENNAPVKSHVFV